MGSRTSARKMTVDEHGELSTRWPSLRQTSGDQEKVNDRGMCGVNDWFKGMVRRTRQAVVTVLAVAAGVNLAWRLLAPVVPVLVCLVVVGTVLWVALGGRISGGGK